MSFTINGKYHISLSQLIRHCQRMYLIFGSEKQFASISTETNSEKELWPKNETKSERVPVLDTFGEK